VQKFKKIKNFNNFDFLFNNFDIAQGSLLMSQFNGAAMRQSRAFVQFSKRIPL